MPATASSELVVLKGRVAVDWTVCKRLLEIERRGAQFVLLDDGRFRVVPPSVLTADDVTFLRQHRDEARRVLEYDADAVKEPT